MLYLVLIFLIAVFLWVALLHQDFSRGQKPAVGVTFSQPHARWLGLDWRAVYLDILDNLRVRNLRLIAAWNQIEKAPGRYDFSDLDWQVSEARKRDAKILLVVGRRAPRWPECHIPDWAKNLSEQEQQEKALQFLEAVAAHYKEEQSIFMWQLDNEPFVEWFGECPLPDPKFIAREIKLVKMLDSRPVLITDSGELSWWTQAARAGDYFGTTMYRTVWGPMFGYLNYDYLLPPAFYTLRARFNGLPPERVIISELQAEAWLPRGDQNISLQEQRKSMSAKKLRANLDFARRTGFSTAYLWGAEYWYWLKERGDDSLLQAGKEIWAQ